MEKNGRPRNWEFVRVGRGTLLFLAIGAVVWMAAVVFAHRSALDDDFDRDVSEQISAATPSCAALTLENARLNRDKYGQPDPPNLTQAEIQTRQACGREQGVWDSSRWNVRRADATALVDALTPLVAMALVPPIELAIVIIAGIFAWPWLARRRVSSRSATHYLVAGILIGGLCLWQALAGQLSAKDLAVPAFPLFGTFLGATLAFRLHKTPRSDMQDLRRLTRR